ncbi:hypothetical protein Patl1_12769 [Pistacia atlantica]|uniref:Uncharacterized protein n=1 Tax=Pistacia atlantica TaxID=434234 RepID=A0ACC1AS82_9ROSI|nr:hypothetical protein Patl1_12769 [Pistacia atlantica]
MSAPRLRETIIDCLSELQSDSDEVQQKALQTLASITKVSPQNRSLLAQTDGAISTLLELSESSSTIIQTLSLSILFNLSLNPDLKLSLAEMETIHLLNAVIESPASPESSKLASSLICSLAMLDKNKAKFGVASTIQLLVKEVSAPNGPAGHHLLSCLAELVHFHGNCTLAVRSEAVTILIQVIGNTETEDLAGTSLGRSWSSCKEGAAEILIRLFDESEGCVRDALRLSESSSVLADPFNQGISYSS